MYLSVYTLCFTKSYKVCKLFPAKYLPSAVLDLFSLTLAGIIFT